MGDVVAVVLSIVVMLGLWQWLAWYWNRPTFMQRVTVGFENLGEALTGCMVSIDEINRALRWYAESVVDDEWWPDAMTARFDDE